MTKGRGLEGKTESPRNSLGVVDFLKIIMSTMPSVAGLLTGCLIVYIHDNIKYSRDLTKQVGLIADEAGNNDGNTTSDEWAKVYKELGIQYDVHISNPYKDLTNKQKVDYLRNY